MAVVSGMARAGVVTKVVLHTDHITGALDHAECLRCDWMCFGQSFSGWCDPDGDRQIPPRFADKATDEACWSRIMIAAVRHDRRRCTIPMAALSPAAVVAMQRNRSALDHCDLLIAAENVPIDGHHRRRAAEQLAEEYSYPTGNLIDQLFYEGSIACPVCGVAVTGEHLRVAASDHGLMVCEACEARSPLSRPD